MDSSVDHLMEAPRATPACRRCHFRVIKGTEHQCRRYPPVRHDKGDWFSAFPLVQPSDWCGEFAERVSVRQEPRR